jgi:hypothetical protein
LDRVIFLLICKPSYQNSRRVPTKLCKIAARHFFLLVKTPVDSLFCKCFFLNFIWPQNEAFTVFGGIFLSKFLADLNYPFEQAGNQRVLNDV